jgi:TolB-like protein
MAVLLYELMTGARPYRLKAGASVGMLERAITTVEVSKPSTQIESQMCEARAVSAEKLARLLRGDLDVIVLKALAKEPKERYRSASAMAEDLRRHRHGKTIQARPPTLSYRIRKFVHRRRTSVVVAALVAAAILATVGYEIHRFATDEERKIAALPAAKPLGDKSIAVMPFIDLSEKKDQEYFSDGLSEELIDLLTQVKDLQVIARTSSFYFKGKSVTVPQISRALGTANILEGSVRRAGNNLRVTAQLIRADSGAQLWSQTFNRNVTDVFKLQDEISGAVVVALKINLLPGQPQKDHDRSDNPAAYGKFLLGRHFGNRLNIEGYRSAIAALREAIALDPAYAAAYAALSIDETNTAEFLNDSAGFDRALAAADKALALDPQLARGYRARATVRIDQLDFSGAKGDAEMALSLAPDDNLFTEHASHDLGYIRRVAGSGKGCEERNRTRSS